MSRRNLNILGILILMGITSVVSVVGFTFVTGGSGEASAPISAPTLDLSTATPNGPATQMAELSAQGEALQATNDALSTQVNAPPDTSALDEASTQVAVLQATNDGLSALVASGADQVASLEAVNAAMSTAVVDAAGAVAEATSIAMVAATASAMPTHTATPLPTNTPVPPTPTPVPPTATPVPPTPTTAPAAAQSAQPATLYRIVPEESQVTFSIFEELRGAPVTVLGTTNQVAGDILVDFANPAASRVGIIRINARSLTTDNEFRNRAIRSEILESARDEYEFIDFTPTAIEGMPGSVGLGETVTFQITGDLKIRDIVQVVTFEVTATATADRLEGTATTTVTRAQFNLQIPSVPGVANVADEVPLEIRFVAAAVDAPPAEASAEATAEAAADVPASTLYRIVAEESQVTFSIFEELRGAPVTVIGTTNQVAGDILVDFANPAASRVGIIRINARTLATDNEFRNRAIRSEILESARDEYEFIDFTPTAISGMPESVALGETVTFQITGDLKIRDIVQVVTFEVSATATADRLEGLATTTVTRAQFNLQIPNVPSVANVADEVPLEIRFVATAVPQ